MFPTFEQLQSFFTVEGIVSADKKRVAYQFKRGEENYTFTLHVDEGAIHIQIEKQNRTIGSFEFKQIQRFIILDNEMNKKRCALEVVHGDNVQLLELKWKPYFSVILKKRRLSNHLQYRSLR